jgi:dTDP-4-amino-4,6-dideoxygalactose transaminase
VRRSIAVLGGTTSAGDVLAALRQLAEPDSLVHGSAVGEYERAFASTIGTRFAFSFATARVGLYGLLQALEVGRDDEVLLQVPTHIVIPNAIRYLGARPLYVDCERETYNIDLTQAAQRVSPRTKVLLLQHTFGIPVDLEAAEALAVQHGLEIVEDCVHALGSTFAGRAVGSFGRAAIFSTEETKTISTGMGGVVVTDDPALAARLEEFQASCEWPSPSFVRRWLAKLVTYHLLSDPYLHPYARMVYELVGRKNPLPRATSAEEMRGARPRGYLRRLSNAQALLGLRQLRRLEANVNHRRQTAALYASTLAESEVELPRPPAQAETAYVRYPVRVRDREATVRASARHAVLGTWFTSVLEEALSPTVGGYESGSCPRAEEAAAQLVNLPTHPRVRADDAKAIAAAIISSARKTSGSRPLATV